MRGREFENTKWTNGLIKASTLTFWMSEGVGTGEGPVCFHDAELSEPQRPQNTHTADPKGRHSPKQ